MLLHYHPDQVALPHSEFLINKSWDLGVSWSLSFVLDPPLQGGLDVKSGRPWNIIHCMPCKIPCRFCIHSNSLDPLRPSSSSEKWSRTVSAFPTNKRNASAMCYLLLLPVNFKKKWKINWTGVNVSKLTLLRWRKWQGWISCWRVVNNQRCKGIQKEDGAAACN